MDRFFKKIKINSHTNCWEWTGARQPTGYGRCGGPFYNGHYLVHRYSYERFKSPIPPGLQLRHLCNNAKCANPDHLVPGTAYENAQDREATNNHTRGSNNAFSKLTESQAKNIKYSGAPIKEMCEKYNVGPHTVRNIRAGHSWKHI